MLSIPKSIQNSHCQNLTISSVLGFTHHFSWNLNFYHNFSNLEIEDLERLMSFFLYLHLSPFGHDSRVWFGFFIVKSFFYVLINHINPTPSFPIDFVWKSQALFKVKFFA